MGRTRLADDASSPWTASCNNGLYREQSEIGEPSRAVDGRVHYAGVGVHGFKLRCPFYQYCKFRVGTR